MGHIITIILGVVALVVVWIAVIAWYKKDKKKKEQEAAQPTKGTKTGDGPVEPTDTKPEPTKKKNTWI
jgi:heme/copper-type cytochrome/quinol oxidase subunit 2